MAYRVVRQIIVPGEPEVGDQVALYRTDDPPHQIATTIGVLIQKQRPVYWMLVLASDAGSIPPPPGTLMQLTGEQYENLRILASREHSLLDLARLRAALKEMVLPVPDAEYWPGDWKELLHTVAVR